MRCLLLNKSLIALVLGVCLTLCGCEQSPPAAPGKGVTPTTGSTTTTPAGEAPKKEEPPMKEEAPVKNPSVSTPSGSTTGPGVKE